MQIIVIALFFDKHSRLLVLHFKHKNGVRDGKRGVRRSSDEA